MNRTINPAVVCSTCVNRMFNPAVVCGTCGRNHPPDLSCNQARFVEAVMVDLEPVVGLPKMLVLTILLYNLKENRP